MTDREPLAAAHIEAWLARHEKHAIRYSPPEYESGALLCDDCATDNYYRFPHPEDHTQTGEWESAAEDVHRAFCDPDHELVSDWDREMSESLLRHGYSLVPTEDAALAAAVRRLEGGESLTAGVARPTRWRAAERDNKVIFWADTPAEAIALLEAAKEALSDD